MKKNWFFVFCSLLMAFQVSAGSSVAGYVTSSACQSCHQKQFESWQNSHHGWAWRLPEANNVLGDFDDRAFQHGSITYHFKTVNDQYYIIADDARGEMRQYPLHSVAGVSPLQQYIVETGKGHLQALDVVWDAEKKHWYHLYPDEDTGAGNGMHWTGVYKNWNARCAECHATDYRKNYNPVDNAYHSTQSEIGVGCEACHGPGEAHIAWAQAPGFFDQTQWHQVNHLGLMQTYVKHDASSQINMCATCHSRREPISGNSPGPGTAFSDNYRLSLIRDGLYFNDGQIHDEVYVYGSFLQSKMYAKGVTCTNCHDAHSYTLKAHGNAVCTQCHNPTGNPAFPTLTQKRYDDASHHFHQQTEGSQCVQCHMPQRNYMVVDGRRDHGFRIPRPDLTEKHGIPNTCNYCHSDKTASWAVSEIKKRYPQGRLTHAHAFADVLALSSTDQLNRFNTDMIEQHLVLAGNTQLPGIVRASALARLTPVVESVNLDKLQGFLKDTDVWVRAEATNLLAMSSDENRQKMLATMLSDPAKSVRLRAIKAFVNVDINSLKFSVGLTLKKVMKEYQQSLADKADFPENQLVIGGLALTMRNVPAAIRAFDTAVTMDPQLVQAWVMLTRIHAAIGQTQEARQTLERAIKANPEVAEFKQMLKEAGF